jgi:predicted ester cyclase
MIEPFVALMRRYTIDYTNSHDLAVCDEIMEPDYVVHISGMSLVRDAAYKPAVEMVFGRFPGLCLAIHEILTNGDRLAMRFSEHAATEQGRLACWAGIALYRWNGAKLLECRVEQDFLSQRRQLASGRPDALEPPHLDPWTTTRGLAADRGAERVVGDWLGAGELGRAAAGRIDDTDVAKFAPILEATDRVDIHDLFSAGPSVAFHASIVGRYRGGLADADEHRGKEARLDLAGIAMVAAGEVAEVRIVTDRLGTESRLTGRALF